MLQILLDRYRPRRRRSARYGICTPQKESLLSVRYSRRELACLCIGAFEWHVPFPILGDRLQHGRHNTYRSLISERPVEEGVMTNCHFSAWIVSQMRATGELVTPSLFFRVHSRRSLTISLLITTHSFLLSSVIRVARRSLWAKAAVVCPLSTIHYPLSVIHYPPGEQSLLLRVI